MSWYHIKYTQTNQLIDVITWSNDYQHSKPNMAFCMAVVIIFSYQFIYATSKLQVKEKLFVTLPILLAS